MGPHVGHPREVTGDPDAVADPLELAGVQAASFPGAVGQHMNQSADDQGAVEQPAQFRVAWLVRLDLHLEKVVGLEGEAAWLLAFLSLAVEEPQLAAEVLRDGLQTHPLLPQLAGVIETPRCMIRHDGLPFWDARPYTCRSSRGQPASQCRPSPGGCALDHWEIP
jgi:hypothetical protein